MAAIKSQHSRLFERLVAERRQQLVDAISTGVLESEYPKLVGQIRGLDEALRMSEEADYKLSGDFNVDGA